MKGQPDPDRGNEGNATMSTEQHLVVLPDGADPSVLFTETGRLATVLEEIERRAPVTDPDMSTEAGRSVVRSAAYRVVRSKTFIASAAKDLKKRIDEDRQDAEARLQSLATEIRKPLTRWEDAREAKEKARREALQRRVAAIYARGQGIEAMGLDELRARRAEVRAITLTEAEWQEALPLALTAKDAVLSLIDECVEALTTPLPAPGIATPTAVPFCAPEPRPEPEPEPVAAARPVSIAAPVAPSDQAIRNREVVADLQTHAGLTREQAVAVLKAVWNGRIRHVVLVREPARVAS